MLDAKDLKAIGDLFERKFDQKIMPALTEFFDTLILPYFEHNEKDHAEIKKILHAHDKRFDSQDREIDSIQRKLEKNEDNHEEMFGRLDKNDKDHKEIFLRLGKDEDRITRLETLSSSS